MYTYAYVPCQLTALCTRGLPFRGCPLLREPAQRSTAQHSAVHRIAAHRSAHCGTSADASAHLAHARTRTHSSDLAPTSRRTHRHRRAHRRVQAAQWLAADQGWPACPVGYRQARGYPAVHSLASQRVCPVRVLLFLRHAPQHRRALWRTSMLRAMRPSAPEAVASPHPAQTWPAWVGARAHR